LMSLLRAGDGERRRRILRQHRSGHRHRGRTARLAGVLLLLEPLLEFSLRAYVDDDRHEAVVAPAELRALAAVRTGLFGLEPELVDEAGDRIALDAEVRYPPRVDHVSRREQHPHL